MKAAADDTYILRFEDSIETSFDIVVGADGAWLRVRPLLFETTPYYASVTGLDVSIAD